MLYTKAATITYFSETRHPHGQNDTNFNLLYLRLGYRLGLWPLH